MNEILTESNIYDLKLLILAFSVCYVIFLTFHRKNNYKHFAFSLYLFIGLPIFTIGMFLKQSLSNENIILAVIIAATISILNYIFLYSKIYNKKESTEENKKSNN